MNNIVKKTQLKSATLIPKNKAQMASRTSENSTPVH